MNNTVTIFTIGDLHGSDVWKEALSRKWDVLVFIGDYVDSSIISEEQILGNLQEIIELKNQFKDRIILLWGNHDLSYFYGGHSRHYCSGFRKKMLPELFSLFTANSNLFQAAYQVDHHIWTHAGIVNAWYETYIANQVTQDDFNLASTLNRLFKEYYEPMFHIGAKRGGLNEHGGIFWAHASEVIEDPLPGYHNIFGHTKTRNGIVRYNTGLKNTKITMVDCLDTSADFFEIDMEKQRCYTQT
ncbi:MAG TPA: metallophosphoesterase [Bacteroidales bacterium]|nr:metallophosphoesterase [Bacteroidales bacterium]HSA44328.1 metallophosphoesterase [Bacteroidales bacterium]